VYLLLLDTLIIEHEHEEDKDLHEVLNLCHVIYFFVIGTNKTSTD